MHCAFEDIIKKCGKPDWYDQDGVPRYGAFDPDNVSNIYADHAALLEIQCQQCRQMFIVSVHCKSYDVEYKQLLWVTAYESKYGKKPDESHRSRFYIDSEGLHRIQLPKEGDAGWFIYGDPPIHGIYDWHKNCMAGDTMNSIPNKMVEFWMKEDLKWVRRPEYEVYVRPKWADEDIPDTATL